MGEIFAISTAACWAIATIFLKKAGETVKPIALNLHKNVVAFVLIIPTIFILENWSAKELIETAKFNDYGLLIVSGVVGIAIADTLFFKCLNILGAGTTAIVETLYTPFVLGLAVLFLDERLNVQQLIGVALIVGAILLATMGEKKRSLSRSELIDGIGYGAFGLFLMVVGIIMFKPILESVPLLLAIEVRLTGGILGLVIVLVIRRHGRLALESFGNANHPKSLLLGSLLGGYVTLILWTAGMKYTLASIAAPLNQMATIFTILLAAAFLGEKLTPEKIGGTLLAIGGVILITLF